MRGSKRWRRARRARGERYWRMYGYATEAALMRWRKLRRMAAMQLREAIAEGQP
jgi:hypothetical protein